MNLHTHPCEIHLYGGEDPIFLQRHRTKRTFSPPENKMASQYNDHSLPTHSGQQSSYPTHQQQVHYEQQPPLQQTYSNTSRPPRSRGLSVHSDKSGGSNTKKDPAETHVEKERQRLHSKADPTMAMNEAEPCTSSHFNNGETKLFNG